MVKKANEFEAIKKVGRSKITLFLVGCAFPKSELDNRVQMAEELGKCGINAVVMETLPEWRNTTTVDRLKDKCDELHPELFLVVFPKGGDTHYVTFQIGYLCGHFGRETVKEKLAVCIALDKSNRRSRISMENFVASHMRGIVPKCGFQYDPKTGEIIDKIVTLVESRAVELNCI